MSSASEIIRTRRSIRKFADKPVPEEDIKKILAAGMSGPTAVNARPWVFIVVTDKEMLLKMAECNGRPADPMKGAAFGILVCGDEDRRFREDPGYWSVDCSIAAQNLILAAWDIGVGSVWLGTWPREKNVSAQKELFGLPDNIVPHSLIAFGYPTEEELSLKEKNPKVIYEAERVHFNKW